MTASFGLGRFKKSWVFEGGHAIRHNQVGGKDKGLSSLIGMALLIVIFGIAATYSLIWVQNTSSYGQTVKEEMIFENQRSAEMLQATSTNITTNQWNLTVVNPTPYPINLAMILNSTYDNLTYTTNKINGFSNVTYGNLPSANGHFELVTQRGNIFYTTSQINPIVKIRPLGYWNVTFWYKTSPSDNPHYLGNAIWHDLSFSKSYPNATYWNPSATIFGFNATTIVMPNSNSVFVSVGLFSLNTDSGAYSPVDPTNILTITLGSLTSLHNTGNFSPLDPKLVYQMNVTYVNNAALPQIVTVAIEGADFG